MKSRPGQGLTGISKKIRLKQNDHTSRRTQRSPHTRRAQHPLNASPTLAARSTLRPHPPPRPAPAPKCVPPLTNSEISETLADCADTLSHQHDPATVSWKLDWRCG